MAPITGKTHEVRMLGGDAQGYRFDPANITVKQGDGIKWIMVSGGPHNVAFDAATIPADVKPQLDANMGTDKMGELSSNMKMNPDETITVSFANIKPGKYPVQLRSAHRDEHEGRHHGSVARTRHADMTDERRERGFRRLSYPCSHAVSFKP